METPNHSAEAHISLKKAMVIIIGTMAVVIAIGLAVGYKFFWNQFDTTTKVDREMAMVQDVLKKYPNNPVAHLQAGLQYIARGDNKKALDELEKAYKLDKNNVTVRLYLGIVYKDDKQLDKAQNLLSGVVKDNPVNILGLVNLGTVYHEKKDYKNALEKFNLAIGLNPGAADIFVLRAKTYAAMGQKDKALADVDKALKFVPDYQEALDAKKEISGK